jgi:hypothetical protein
VLLEPQVQRVLLALLVLLAHMDHKVTQALLVQREPLGQRERQGQQGRKVRRVTPATQVQGLRR